MTAGHAGHGGHAGDAGHAGHGDHAGNADNAGHGGHADHGDHGGNADHAGDGDHAGNAGHADDGGHADHGGCGDAGHVTFVGAWPGAPDLITLRGAAAIAAADLVIWASSLVHRGILEHARSGAEIVDSAQLPMEGVLPYYQRAAREGLRVARVHSGDPALWGAIQEQLDRCAELGLGTEIVPGVSSFTAAAAAIGRELTIPEVAQSVILTRLGGGKTPMPPGERVTDFARHGTTMALFLSAARSGQLQDELLRGGYPPETPCVIAYQVDLARRADRALRAGRPGRHHEGAQALEAHPGPGRPGPGRRRHPVAPVPPRALPRLPPGRAGPAAPCAPTTKTSACPAVTSACTDGDQS